MKFRPRFSLRTLLLVVTAAAVFCWAYWIGWPWWLVYREQCAFEATVKQLHIGSTTNDMLALPLSDARARAGVIERSFIYPACGWFVRGWPNAVYVGVVLIDESPIEHVRVRFKSVALYRLSPIPKDYQPFSASIRNASRAEYFANPKAEKARYIYAQDFLDFIIGDPKHNPGFKYELIYSDPPQQQ